MALNIYLYKEDLPKDKKFYYNVEVLFGITEIKECDFIRMVLREVEEGEYCDDSFFIDKFGGRLYYEFLSITSKILIAVYFNPEQIVNCIELGRNGYDLLFRLRNGNIFLESDYMEYLIESKLEEVDLTINYDGYSSVKMIRANSWRW